MLKPSTPTASVTTGSASAGGDDRAVKSGPPAIASLRIGDMKRSFTLLRFVNLFCSALLCGGLILTVAALRPALMGLPVSLGVLAQRLVVSWAVLYLPLCGAFCAISAVFLIKYSSLSNKSARFYKIGVGCMILVGLMSIYVGAVLDKEIGSWRLDIVADERTAQVTFVDQGAPASRHISVWNTWGAINAARTVAAVLALACFIMANVQPRVFEHDADRFRLDNRTLTK